MEYLVLCTADTTIVLILFYLVLAEKHYCHVLMMETLNIK